MEVGRQGCDSSGLYWILRNDFIPVGGNSLREAAAACYNCKLLHLAQCLALSADDETFICQKTFNREDDSFSDPPKDLSSCVQVRPVQISIPNWRLYFCRKRFFVPGFHDLSPGLTSAPPERVQT